MAERLALQPLPGTQENRSLARSWAFMAWTIPLALLTLSLLHGGLSYFASHGTDGLAYGLAAAFAVLAALSLRNWHTLAHAYGAAGSVVWTFILGLILTSLAVHALTFTLTDVGYDWLTVDLGLMLAGGVLAPVASRAVRSSQITWENRFMERRNANWKQMAPQAAEPGRFERKLIARTHTAVPVAKPNVLDEEPEEAPQPLPAGLERLTVKETFADLVGMADVKQHLREAIDLMRHPEKQAAFGLEPPSGILLHGPPGTGKTFVARCAAGQFGEEFYYVDANTLVDSKGGETENRIAAIFAYARAHTPCILFIDELDTLAPNRGKLQTDWMVDRVNALLRELDGIKGKANAPILLAATNRKDGLDPAVLRPGRLTLHVLVDLPDEATREATIRHHLAKRRHDAIDFKALAKATEGRSQADLKELVNRAALAIYRENPNAAAARAMTMADLQKALRSL